MCGKEEAQPSEINGDFFFSAFLSLTIFFPFCLQLLQGIIYNQQTRMDVEHASLRRMLFEARAEAM